MAEYELENGDTYNPANDDARDENDLLDNGTDVAEVTPSETVKAVLDECRAYEAEHEAESLAAAEEAEFNQTVDDARALELGILADDPDAVLQAYLGIAFTSEPEPEPVPVEDPEAKARREFIAGLRDLADFFEQNPEIDKPYSGCTLTLYVSDKKKLAKYARAFGHAEKVVDDYSFRLSKEFGTTGVKVETYSSRQSVCERVKIGEEFVPTHKIAATEERFVEGHMKDIYEWKCPSLLAIGEADAEPVAEPEPASAPEVA